MIKALAPRMPRGCSWVSLSIVLLGVFPCVVEAQTQPKTKPSDTAKKAKAEPAKAKDEDEAAEPAKAKDAAKKGDEAGKGAPAGEAEKGLPFELFEDPNAKTVLANKYPQLRAPTLRPQDNKQVMDMAKGSITVDRDVIARYVGNKASDLTNPTYLRAITDPPDKLNPNSQVARGFREASAALLDPMDLARKGNNAEFLKTYTEELVRQLPPVLENHLLARIEAIIALGQASSPEALNIFVKQLNDPGQTVWVKLWAARGITNIAQSAAGNRVDSALGARAIPAAKVLADFLNREKDAPWPVLFRAVEALGSLRLAARPEAQAKLEMAEAAMRLLANPSAKPEVRAQAAWALGMMRISAAAGRFNYPLVAYYIGVLAADLGDRVVSSYSQNLTQAQYWTGYLVYQVYPALAGQEGARDSGLLKMPGAANSLSFIRQLADHVRPVVRISVDLVSKTPKGQMPQVAKDLSERVGQLRTFLDKNAPNDVRLVPGGAAFPVKPPVAAAAGGNARVAGAGGR